MERQKHPAPKRGTRGGRVVALATAMVSVVMFGGPAATPAHAAREFSARYVPGVWVGCDLSGLGAPCIGAVTGIRVLQGETQVRVQIHDDSGRQVGGYLYFYDHRGNRSAPPRQFCGEARVRLPRGVVELAVDPSPPTALWPSVHCGGRDASGSGRVDATFS